MEREFDENQGGAGGDEAAPGMEVGGAEAPQGPGGASGGGSGTQTQWKNVGTSYSTLKVPKHTKAMHNTFMHYIPKNIEHVGVERKEITIVLGSTGTQKDQIGFEYWQIGAVANTGLTKEAFEAAMGITPIGAVGRQAAKFKAFKQTLQIPNGGNWESDTEDRQHSRFYLKDSWRMIPFGYLRAHLDETYLKSCMHNYAGFEIKKLTIKIEGTKAMKTTTLDNQVQKNEVGNIGWEAFVDTKGRFGGVEQTRNWDDMTSNLNNYMQDNQGDPAGVTNNTLATADTVYHNVLGENTGIDVSYMMMEEWERKNSWTRKDELGSFNYRKNGTFWQSNGWQDTFEYEWTPMFGPMFWGDLWALEEQTSTNPTRLGGKPSFHGRRHYVIAICVLRNASLSTHVTSLRWLLGTVFASRTRLAPTRPNGTRLESLLRCTSSTSMWYEWTALDVLPFKTGNSCANTCLSCPVHHLPWHLAQAQSCHHNPWDVPPTVTLISQPHQPHHPLAWPKRITTGLHQPRLPHPI